MSKYTLLEIVQDIHNDLGLDLVNTIGDTPDSTRVAQIAKTVFFEFINRRDWPHLRELSPLSSLADTSRKTGLGIPEAVSKIEWIKYNTIGDGDTDDSYTDVNYLYPDEFLQLANNLKSSNTNTEYVTTTSGVSFLIRNDIAPKYWTSFDDNVIYFDSYDSSVESTTQGNKVQALLYKEPSWSSDDAAVPDLPSEAFPGFIAEIKAVAAFRIKEVQDGKAEQQAVRQQRRLSNQAWRAKGDLRQFDYGRHSKGRARSSNLFDK